MFKFILIIFLFMESIDCKAAEFECFLGAVAIEHGLSIDVKYNNYLIFVKEKHSLSALPFLACGFKFNI